MVFEWDEKKNHYNQAKHGISFAGAALVFLDPFRIEGIDDRKEYGETRYQTIGIVNNIILYVVYTQRNAHYRLISARRANQNERETYLYYRHITV
jgi:uncharacterized protein